MEKKRIGRSELLVSPLAFGANVFGWTLDESQSFSILDAFVAAGFDLIDTADVYPRWATGVGGESETIIGRWMKLRKNRSKVVIATKVGMDMGEGAGLRRKYIIRAAEASLRRLQTDHIDLYQSHRDDAATPVEETLDAYSQLIKEGKVRVIGASNFTAARMREALAAAQKNGLPRYECVQPHYNLCERSGFESELESLCLSEQVGVITYYSLASGFLTGKYRTEEDLGKSVRGKAAGRYLDKKGMCILGALDTISARLKEKPASVALAWLLHRPSVTAPIASATSLQQLKELEAAAGLRLSEQDMKLLDEASR